MMWEDKTEYLIEGVYCPFCKHKFVLNKEWWSEQPEIATECPLCDGKLLIDDNYIARPLVSVVKDLEKQIGFDIIIAPRSRYDYVMNDVKALVSYKVFYIEAKEWPNYSEELRTRLWQRK